MGCDCHYECEAMDCRFHAVGGAASETVICRAGSTCFIHCESGARCDVRCEPGSTCTVDCEDDSQCDVTCEDCARPRCEKGTWERCAPNRWVCSTPC